MTSSPTVKRRRLSAALQQARQAANLTPKAAAAELGWDMTKIHRIERNKWVRPDLSDIRALMDLYGITDPRQREALETLTKESRQKGWWADYQDVFRTSLPDFEAGASLIRTYEAMLVPGLLQTPDYARAVFRAQPGMDDSTTERRVEARMARQEILVRDTPPDLMAVIDEAALRRLVGGPAVMKAQIEHLVKMAERPNIVIQVLMLEAGAHAAIDGGFVMLDFPSDEDPSLVVQETATDSLYLETPDELHRYTVMYGHVQALALAPEASARSMESMIRQM